MSLAGAVAAGVAALLGGALAGWFEARQLSILVQWSSLSSSTRFLALRFAHWEFLFAISFFVSALLTTAQTFFLLEAYLVEFVYPLLFQDARPADVPGQPRE